MGQKRCKISDDFFVTCQACLMFFERRSPHLLCCNNCLCFKLYCTQCDQTLRLGHRDAVDGFYYCNEHYTFCSKCQKMDTNAIIIDNFLLCQNCIQMTLEEAACPCKRCKATCSVCNKVAVYGSEDCTMAWCEDHKDQASVSLHKIRAWIECQNCASHIPACRSGHDSRTRQEVCILCAPLTIILN